MDALKDYFFGEFERVGFILKSGEIVEVENICDDPRNGFEVKGEDLLKYADEAAATWHTHPNTSKVLSVNDYESFLGWPHLKHYIVGVDGIACYVVKDEEVIVE
jgi:proteasome lid subunit RPN8/RPN11